MSARPTDVADHPRHTLDREERDPLLSKLSRVVAGVSGVRIVWAFGSFVRNQPFHDLDLGVVVSDPDDWRAVARVLQAAEGALGDSPFPVDVVPLNDATPAMRRRVSSEGRVLYEREVGDALDFRVQATSEHIDFLEFMRARAGAA
jgi:predicted nucleotidyltransferase